MDRFCPGICLFVLASICIDVKSARQPQLRNVINDKYKLWEHETVVYQISTLIDDSNHAVIEQAMQEIQNDANTGDVNCVSFEKREGAFRDRSDYLFITEATDGMCKTSNVGMVGGRQKLYLTDECMYKREIMSLLLVTLGLYHEHQRPDRDQYILVHMDNVQDVARSHFEKIPSSATDLLGYPYDFDSITHYSPYAFAKDPRLPTITANVSDVSFGNKRMLSYHDVLKLQTLYICGHGYPMLINSTDFFRQKPKEAFYPQWRDSSNMPDYMTTKCNKKPDDVYTLTVLHGATWKSKLPLPAGNFSISVDICISSSSPDIKSYIQLMEGPDSHRLNYTSSSGEWETLTVHHTSENEWNVVMKAHILWGKDVLALDNLIVRCIGHC